MTKTETDAACETEPFDLTRLTLESITCYDPVLDPAFIAFTFPTEGSRHSMC